MTTNNKNKRTSNPLIKKLMANASPLDRIKNKNRVEIACTIDDLIKERNYSYIDFAKKINKQPSEISKFVSGTHNFTIDILAEIAFGLNISINELFIEQKPQVIYKTELHLRSNITEKNLFRNTSFSNM
jgi:predicted transcriptional regulator